MEKAIPNPKLFIFRKLEYVNNEIIKERKAEKRFTDLNLAMQQYFLVTGRQLEPYIYKYMLNKNIYINFYHIYMVEHYMKDLIKRKCSSRCRR